MTLQNIDWAIIVLFFLFALAIGIYSAKKSGENSNQYFLSGRNMPWWLLGFSMVATTFSTDTPNLVTDIVRQNGIAGNWVWWAFLLTGMLTVFVYARLWRRSGVSTDLEFYELRYGGIGAKWLRVFRALYLGIVFNVLAMSGVVLAALKIGEVMLGWDAFQTISLCAVVTLLFSFLGGFRGVILTDFLLFIMAMIGAIGASYVVINLDEIGTLENLFAHENVIGKINMIPAYTPENKLNFYSIFFIPIAVQWWASWYPGSEPGGGGYIAQRMLASKDENHALKATLFFNVAHFALRPWPWIIVALASLVIFPDLQSLRDAFPQVPKDKVGHDLAYPAMLTFLPAGLLGIMLTSLGAAFMSTMSTHLNWGSSYIALDVYKRVVHPSATERQVVWVGKISTIILMILAVVLALYQQSANDVFETIILFGAGSGLIFILRWFWWRINIWSEITAMLSSGVIAILLKEGYIFQGIQLMWMFPISVLLTTILWILITLLTPPESEETLRNFCKKINIGGPGWKKITSKFPLDHKYESANKMINLPYGILGMILGCFTIYSMLFLVGSILKSEMSHILIFSINILVGIFGLSKIWNKLSY